MQLLIKQRVFSWSDTYDIYDEQGNKKYFVKNEFISLGHRLHVYDAAHNEIGFIKQKLFCFLPTFEIEWNGQLMGHIEKRFALFRPKYDVDFMGWRAEGDFMGWDYDVYEACSAVVHVHKKLLSWGDMYVIEYDNPSNEIPALLLVCGLYLEACSADLHGFLQDASGVLRLLEFRLDGSFSRWQGFRLCHLARV